MANFLHRWYTTLSRTFGRYLFADTLRQTRRPLVVASPSLGCHTHQVLQQRVARILFLWLHLAQPNAQGLHLQFQWGTTQDILFAQRPFLSRTTMTCALLQPIRRLFLSDRRIQALMMTTQPQRHMTVPMKTLQPRLQLHRMLLLQLLVLVTLSEDGHKSMIRNSSASNRMPEPDTLGKPLVNDFTGNLTAARHAGTG